MENLQESPLFSKETSVGSTNTSKRPKLILVNPQHHLSTAATGSHSFAAASSDLNMQLCGSVVKWIWYNSFAWLFSHDLKVFVEQHLRIKSCKTSPYKFLIDLKKKGLKNPLLRFPPYKIRIKTLIVPTPQESVKHNETDPARFSYLSERELM